MTRIRKFIAALVLFTLGAISGAVLLTQVAEAATPIQYKVVRVPSGDYETNMQQLLNENSAQGWQFVDTTAAMGLGVLVIFKK